MFFSRTEVTVLAMGASSSRALSRRQLYPPHLVPSSYSTLHLGEIPGFLVLPPGLGVGLGILAVSLTLGLTLGHTLMLHPSHGITLHPSTGTEVTGPHGK